MPRQQLRSAFPAIKLLTTLSLNLVLYFSMKPLEVCPTSGGQLKPGAIQYCGHEFQSALAGSKMKSSMSRKGDCWDNAPIESFWGRLKVGRLHGRRFATRRQAMDEVIDWMTFYNHRRIHSTLGYVSPMQFEKSWNAAQLLKAA